MPGELPTGIGNDQQASQATAFIRQQPWYREWLTARGIQEGPDQQVKLNAQQRAELMALSLQHGIGLNHKYDMIDENGQIAEEHHKLKKVAIAAAIAGLAVTGLGAAGIGPLAGVLGGASTAATIPTTMGVTGAEFGGAAATAAIPTALTAGAAGTLAATSTVPAIGALVPATTSSLGAAAGTAGGTASTLGKVGTLLSRGQQASDILGAAGRGVGEAATAAGNNRLSAGDLALRAQQLGLQTAQTNTSGQAAFENELLNRAKQEEGERTDALKNIYRQSYATNRTPGPYNTRGLTAYSPEYLAALKNLTTQGGEKLSTKGKYDTSNMPELKPYDPVTTSFDPKAFMDEYGNPSTLEKVGGWLSPTLSTLGTVAKYWK